MIDVHLNSESQSQSSTQSERARLEFKAAIFDLDGTLIDSMGVWEKVDRDFLAKRHLPVPDGYIEQLSAMSFREAAEYTIALFGLKEKGTNIIAEWNEMVLYEYGHYIILKPHAREYLLYLKQSHVKLATATSLPKILYEPVLKSNGIYQLFDALSSTDEVSRGKEYPDIYLLAAQKLAVLPGDCVAFDDILAAITAIKAAGMKAFGMYDSYSAHNQKAIRQIADGYIYDFAEMFPLK
jgi:HAD superfamily hydrolase (TIGR01509 family)